jgi:excisionase family DNA binding protein
LESTLTDRLLDADEVGALLNVPTRWVREQTRSGRLPCVRLGRYRRYDRGDVLAWVEAQKSGGAGMVFRKHKPVPDGGTK